MSARGRALVPFLALYGATYAAFGVASPFLPSFLSERGLSASEISLLLATGTAARLIAAPLAGQVADRLGRPRPVLIAALAASAVVALLYLPAQGFSLLFAVSLLHACALAPVTPLSDSMALAQRAAFDYGWVRGAGSAAFVAGTFLSGFAIGQFGLASFLLLNAGWLALAVAFAFALPAPAVATPTPEAAQAGDMRALFRNRAFLCLIATAAPILASHAMHDAFAVIRWRGAGFSGPLVSTLWSEAVVAEVVVFTLVGPWLLRRLSPGTCMMLAAAAGIVRWIVVGQTLSPLALACVEPLHGLTFALLHLSAMRVIAEVVPPTLAASAQATYGVLAAGAASALVTLASGPLFDRFAGEAFLAMAGLCVVALPLAWNLRRLPQTLAGGTPIPQNPG